MLNPDLRNGILFGERKPLKSTKKLRQTRRETSKD
jgi:hypothetical protein